MDTPAAGFIDLFIQRSRSDPERIFATFNGKTIRFADLERQSRSFAFSLLERGIASGDRVALMMRNHPAVLSCVFGLARAGIVWVPINPEQRGSNLRHQIEHSKPRFIIVDREQLPALSGCDADLSEIPVLVHDSEGGDLLPLLAADPPLITALAQQPGSPFAIMYTSGTTGQAKGVIVTHAMMRFAGEASALLADACDGDVLFMWEPLFHIGGAQVLLMPLLRQLTLAMVDRFSVSRFWHQVRACQATHIHYLGGILQMLMNQPPRPNDREHPVRVAWGAGCSKDSWTAFQERFGVQLREAYGMTETSSIATYNGANTLGSVGRSVPWFEVEVVDPQGHRVPPSVHGEIVISATRAGSLFSTYFRDPEATSHALINGKLHTKDIGSIDTTGQLYFHGRMTDSMRCRGENVSAWEIEHVATSHPAVDDCAAIAVAADVGEQEIKLCVKLKPGHVIQPGEISEWLAHRLTPYQNPRYIVFIDDFERTPTQRIMKHVLSKTTDDCWDRASVQPQGARGAEPASP